MTKEELIKLSRENLRKSKQGSLCECYDEAFIKGYQLSEKLEKLKKEHPLVTDERCFTLSWFSEIIPSVLSEVEE